MIRRRAGRAAAGERGFTLVELMIAVALLGIGTTFMTMLFLKSFQNWKWNFDSLILQRNMRLSMSTVTKALREAKPGTVVISTPTWGGVPAPKWSSIAFLDGRSQRWCIYQKGVSVYMVIPGQNGLSATSTVASDIDALSFVYPSFQDLSLIAVGITGRKLTVLRNSPAPVIFQLVERVMLRNP